MLLIISAKLRAVFFFSFVCELLFFNLFFSLYVSKQRFVVRPWSVCEGLKARDRVAVWQNTQLARESYEVDPDTEEFLR